MRRLHLPSRPAPDRIEALHSYASRLAEANGLTLTELLGYRPTPTQWRLGDDRLLDTMTEVTGTPVEFLRGMTFADHDVAPGGALVGFAGLRRHDQAVVCHHCYRRDGVRLRQWEHALVVDCCDCGRLLEPLKEPHPLMRRPARGQTRFELGNTRTELEWSLDSAAARDSFRAIRRAAGPILRGITHSWPRFSDPQIKQWHDLAADDLERYPGKRDGGRPASPYAATVVIMHAWDKIVVGRDFAMADRLERRFPNPNKKRPARRYYWP